MNTLQVKAATGLSVPMEDKPRTYITDAVTQVPDSSYYMRRIAEGDLVIVDDDDSGVQATSDDGTPKKLAASKTVKGAQ